MADVVSPLDEHLQAGRFGKAGHPTVSLSEVRAFRLLQLAAWPETVSNVAGIGAQALGVAKAPGPGQSTPGKNGTLLRVEPLKWWLIADGHGDVTPPVIPPEDGNFLDLSHSRTWLKVGGDNAAVLLNHFLPIDLRENAFPANSVASTAFHHIGVTLWRSEGAFNFLLPRSFALSLWQMLHESAAQYGLDVT